MGRRADFEPIKTADGWMVSVPPGMSASGRRVRRFFGEDFKKAQKFAATVRKRYHDGLRGNLISGELAIQAGIAAEILDPLGITLVEAARIVAARKNAEGDVQTFEKRYEAMMAAEEMRWSDRYVLDMEKVPKWVGNAIMRMRCGEVTEPVLLAALREHGASAASTIQMRRRMAMAVLNWKPDRHSRRNTEIRILTFRECGRVLRACETREQRRAVAMLLWAGIRPDAEHGEISRLQWDAVREDEIYVSPEVSKVGDRHIPIKPRLARWIAGHPKTGPVRPGGWKRSWQRIRKEAGIADMQDVLRHTFASHYLAAFGEEAAKLAMGHTRGSDTLFRHYRRSVTKEQGLAFFGVKKKKLHAKPDPAADLRNVPPLA